MRKVPSFVIISTQQPSPPPPRTAGVLIALPPSPAAMLDKLTRLMRRRSLRVDAGSTQDARGVQIAVDDPQPQPPERDVVDTAPDLIRSCSLETPFPSVAFGGYIKYYRAHGEPTSFTEPNTPFNPPVIPPPLPPNVPPSPAVSLSTKSPEHPTKTVREAKRKARRYSLSGAFSLSDKSPQIFRWKRATCLISSSAAEHDLSPLFSRSPSTRRPTPSFDLAHSRSSSKGSSESSHPDSIGFEFRHATPDSDSTLLPNSPTSIYSNNDDDEEEEEDGMIIVKSPNPRCGDLENQLQCRPTSPSSYVTAQTCLSQG